LTIRSRQLHDSSLVGVRDMQCRPESLACGCEECSSRHVLVFPRRGAFVLHEGSQSAVMDSSHVGFFTADRPRRVSHLETGGDDCTAVTYADEILDEAAAAAGVPAAERRRRPFPVVKAPLDAAAVLKSQIFFGDLVRDDASALKAEERAMDLLREAFAAMPRWVEEPVRPRNAKRLRNIVLAAQEWIAARPFENWSLGDLARDVGSSPYHLLRQFRAETGSTIHQYRTQLRLAAAARMILEGCDDLTALALDLGFSSHSHFSDAFRRRFGMAPSALRRGAGRAQRAQLRKNSTAPWSAAE
jgi:AraC-like DNA-binding protein